MVKYLWLLTIIVIVFSSLLISKPQIRQTSGSCKPTDVSSTWTSTALFNDKGRPISASGINCDGVAWGVNFPHESVGSSMDTTDYLVTAMIEDANTLHISCNLNVTTRIINVQTGAWASNQTTTASDDYYMDISSLPNGVYAVMVFDANNYAVDMSNTFYK